MRNRFQQFMYGRYGMDQLNRFLSTMALIILVVSIFVRRPIVEIVRMALLFWCYYRMFSRNVSKRAAENQKYMNFRYRVCLQGEEGKMADLRFCKFCTETCTAEIQTGAEKDLPFFCMSELCAESTCTERKRKNLYYLSEV